MSLVRMYTMIASDGQADALAAALGDLGRKVRPIDGCLGVELLEDDARAGRFTFLERWSSLEAHKAGGRLLGREAFAPVMAVLASPPEAAWTRSHLML